MSNEQKRVLARKSPQECSENASVWKGISTPQRVPGRFVSSEKRIGRELNRTVVRVCVFRDSKKQCRQKGYLWNVLVKGANCSWGIPSCGSQSKARNAGPNARLSRPEKSVLWQEQPVSWKCLKQESSKKVIQFLWRIPEEIHLSEGEIKSSIHVSDFLDFYRKDSRLTKIK